MPLHCRARFAKAKLCVGKQVQAISYGACFATSGGPLQGRDGKGMTKGKIARSFNKARPFIQCIRDLLDPQVERQFRQRQHFLNRSDHAIIKIPGRCGKIGCAKNTGG